MTSLLSATSNTLMTVIYSEIVPQIPEKDAEILSALAPLADSFLIWLADRQGGYIPSQCLAWRGCMRANHASAHAASARSEIVGWCKGLIWVILNAIKDKLQLISLASKRLSVQAYVLSIRISPSSYILSLCTLYTAGIEYARAWCLLMPA